MLNRRNSTLAILVAIFLVVLGFRLDAADKPKNPIIGLYGGANNETRLKAAECGIDVLYPSINWYEPNDWLAAMVAKAHEAGIKVYPSLAAAYDGLGEKHHAFAAANPQFWEKRRDGTVLDRGTQVSLSWVHPEVRAHKINVFTELVRRSGADGVLLDYTRFFGNDSGYNDTLVSEFKKKHGRDPFKIPSDDPQWVRFRAAYVTQFVRELKQSLAKVRPGLELIACVNPNPQECLRNSLQDWGGWLEEGLIDGVTTMIYERDTNNTIIQVQVAKDAIRGRVPLIAMIAPEYDNLPTPQLLKEGSRKSLQAGADGVAYYHEGSVIRLGLWDAVKEVAHWEVAAIRSQPVQHVLNPGFEHGLQSWAIGDGNGVEVVEHGREGGKAMRMTTAAGGSVRQIIDRGFIDAGAAVQLEGWARLESNHSVQLEADITIVYQKGPERRYRVPIELEPTQEWQPFKTAVELGSQGDLKFIIFALSPQGSGGAVLLDDLSLTLAPVTVASSEQWLVSRQKPIRPAEETNVARGQLVRGSSFWENGFDYDNAVDGDISSEDHGKGAAWHSQRPAKDQWIKIYLPETYIVSRIRLLNSSAQAAYRTREYRIELSSDDRSYRVVARGTLPGDGETWTELKIPPTPAKYVRFVGVTGFNLDYAVGLKEIEVY